MEYRSLESGQHIKRVKGFTEILGNYMMKEYPDHLKEEEIPIAAQLVSIADVYDALKQQ